MRKKRTGVEILVNSEVNQQVFVSKHDAARALGISENRITRLINTGRSCVIDGRELWFDELFKER